MIYIRNTIQKELILDIINNSYDHLNAFQIYDKAKETLPNISLGTVYRNLNLLLDQNKIIKIKMNDGKDRYDAKREKHYHFICDKCHKIIDVYNDININISLGKNKVNDYQITFTGLCEECLRKEV